MPPTSTRTPRVTPRPRAERPVEIAPPQHRHLPAWVRRDFARARPALGDLLALLEGDARARVQQRVDEVAMAIGEGRFSTAWQYPDIVAEGRRLLEEQQRRQAEAAREARALESARRRVQTRLREIGEVAGAETSSRLSRALRSAEDARAIAAVEAEADRAVEAARTSTSRRRDREIERTRARIQRALPRGEGEAGGESWQDVLRRFAEERDTGESAP